MFEWQAHLLCTSLMEMYVSPFGIWLMFQDRYLDPFVDDGKLRHAFPAPAWALLRFRGAILGKQM